MKEKDRREKWKLRERDEEQIESPWLRRENVTKLGLLVISFTYIIVSMLDD